MKDGRSVRKARVIPYVERIDLDRSLNFNTLVARAKMLKPEGFESIVWADDVWTIAEGRLTKLTGKNSKTAAFKFNLSPSLGGTPLRQDWGDLCKALFILRFHRKHQAAPNQRNFITAVGYVANAAVKLQLGIATLNLEALDNACREINKHYGEGTAYNLHKAVAEFAASLDSNGICRIAFKYKFSRMHRPESSGGIGHIRLDDPTAAETMNKKMVDPKVFQLVGELYRTVPHIHKYRFYVLVLTLLCCLGRRFSEISLLPRQRVQKDADGFSYIEYFPRKQSKGDIFTPRRRLYMPTDVVPIVTGVLDELEKLCNPARETAAEMHRSGDVDLRFLVSIPADKRLYADDLLRLGVSSSILSKYHWFRREGHTLIDCQEKASMDKRQRYPTHFTNKAGITTYCQRNFFPALLRPLHIDQSGEKIYLKDLLLLRFVGLSTGVYAHWLASQCTHSMMTTFLRYLPDLARSYASESMVVDFTSHHFRHTLNTLLDEGGLSDLLQTRWFGRTNPRDTKVYQHTSREKRALMLREEIRAGGIGGKFVQLVQAVPVNLQDAVLAVRIKAVHDVGTGLCIHHFSQTPCIRHLQCDAECDDYLYVKKDEAKIEEVKRRYAMASAARETSISFNATKRLSGSIDWIVHNERRLKTLAKQLSDFGITDFDWRQYLESYEKNQ